ncbi:MAG: ADP-ribosylation/crystallin J1 [Alphaproteobacteria bacterium]|nr:ADP-ribosylation/crystallin J1 [Alphaproteobacteria bacterium]MBV8408464.1 ADP-ribosylation/crystallin J1 [Alphaproteobacteria bacterium]
MADTVRVNDKVITLWRPVGSRELELIAASDMRAFPPRLPEQPIIYPVLTEAYATKIARDWNAPRGGGFVTRFHVRADFLAHYEIRQAGGREFLEYWIPAEHLSAFNAAIVGQIEVVAEYR